MIQIAISGGRKLESAKADVIESLVVDAERLIRVFDKLMDRESRVVRLDNSVRDLQSVTVQSLANRKQEGTHLGRGHNGERAHHTVGVFLADLRNQEGTHTRASATTERVGDLESLKAVASFRLLSDDIEHGVNELSTLSIVYKTTDCIDICPRCSRGREDLRPLAQLLPAPA